MTAPDPPKYPRLVDDHIDTGPKETPMKNPGLTDAEIDSAIASAARTIKETPGSAVEIAGVRIEACDEYGRTSTTRRAERAEAALAGAAAVLRQFEDQHG